MSNADVEDPNVRMPSEDPNAHSSAENPSVRIPTEEEDDEAVRNLSPIRRTLFPILPYEIEKLKPLLAMMFLITLNYNLLREMKDAFVISDMGTQATFALKTFCVLPASFVLMLIHSKMTLTMEKKRIFFTIVISFLCYFAIYGLFLSNFRGQLEPGKEFRKRMLSSGFFKPVFLSWLKPLMELSFNWTSSLFYVMSEMWGAMVLSLLFFAFSNEICGSRQASRFYPCISFGANMALLFAGIMFLFVGRGLSGAKFSAKEFVAVERISNLIIFSLVVLNGVGLLWLFNYINTQVITNPIHRQRGVRTTHRAKPGIFEGLKIVMTNRFFLSIAAIVICYGISTNLVEGAYKSSYEKKLRSEIESSGKKGKHADDMLKYRALETQAYTQLATAFLSTVFLIGIGNRSVQYFGWLTTAMICPMVLATIGIIFLSLVYNNAVLSNKKSWLSFIAVAKMETLELFIGISAVALSKSLKYVFFDPTKEMLFIRTPDNLRSRSKSAVDVVGARFGKTLGAVIQFLLVFVVFRTKDVRETSSVTLSMLIAMNVLWYVSIFYLSSKYNDSESTGMPIDLEIEEQRDEKSLV